MSRPRTALVAVSLLTAVAASACAAGGNAQTSRERPTINAVGGALGTIAVRNVYVVGPAQEGGSATVVAAFFNGGAESDTLSGVSSPAASGGTLPGSGSVTLNPGGANIYTPAVAAPKITGLQQALLVGQYIPVTFRFARAGDLTLQVPIEPPVGPTATPSASGSASGSATPTATPSAPATPVSSAPPTASAAGPLG